MEDDRCGGAGTRGVLITVERVETARKLVRPPPWRKGAAVSRRAAFTTLDQALSSISNFAVGVAVARLAGPASLGAFVLAYSFWLLLAACHRALITDPLIIYADGIAGSPDRLAMGLAAELALGAVAALVFAVAGAALLMAGQHSFGVAFLLVAPWVIPLLAQDFWRWVGFMRRQPAKSLANDAVFNTVQAASFVCMLSLGHRSLAVAVSSWGIGASAGAVFGLWQFSIRPRAREAIEALAFVRRCWPTSRWLLTDSSTAWGAGQAYIILTAAILGPIGLGGLRAAQSLMAPASVLIQATGSIGLPEASRAFNERGYIALRRTATVIGAMVAGSIAAVAAIVMVAGEPVLRLLYGPGYAQYAASARILAFAGIVLSLIGMPDVVLKVTRRTRSLFTARVCNVTFSLFALVILAPRLGIPGAAWACVVGSAANVFVLTYLFRRSAARPASSHKLEERSRVSDPVMPRRSA